MTRPIDRRQFAVRSSLLGGAFALPELLRRAFAPQDPEPKADDRPAQLRRAIERAKARRRPLLVFVVPAEAQQLWIRGGELGAFLNHGGAPALIDLALCEPVCATAAELLDAIPTARVTEDSWMAVVEVDASRPRARSIAPDLTKIDPEPQYDAALGYEEWQKRLVERQRAIVAATQRALRLVVAPDVAALAARADAVRDSLAEDERAALEGFIAGEGELGSRLALDAAAVLRVAAAAPRNDGDTARILAAVETAAKGVYVTARVPGSKWAHSNGCGTSIEGEQEAGGLAIACGMGSVPALSSRFLYFYTGE